MTAEDELNILLDEAREVVNAMKKRKEPCCNTTEAKLWQALDKNGIKSNMETLQCDITEL